MDVLDALRKIKEMALKPMWSQQTGDCIDADEVLAIIAQVPEMDVTK